MARILVSMPDKFLASIDKLADIEQRTRSELVREALRNYIRKSNSVSPKQAENNAKILENLLD
ncbi:MAG: ribbon-helix-helix domain-containing protein [Candidatus Gastranaerophilales bacterium]|nr:ribbon-helix-helix domain-containing protein [Candidatus Gastranaerophilales bacterium]